MNTSIANLRPSFWKPDQIGQNPFRRPDLAAAIAEGHRISRHLTPVSKQKAKTGESRLLLDIDGESDFAEKGRLPVAGTFADLARLGERIIRGVIEEFYTDFLFTIDKHPPFHISLPPWWRNVDTDEMPQLEGDPMILSLVDDNAKRPVFNGLHVVSGRNVKYTPYRSVNLKTATGENHAVVYHNHLIANKEPGIWAFATHCIEGTDGINIIPELAELIAWAAAARDIQPMYLYKGMLAQVDFFGPFRPCMDVADHAQGSWQTAYLDMIASCNVIDVAGEAEDFCVRYAVQQLIEYYRDHVGRPDVLDRIRFIGDCTSPIVPGGPAVKALHADMAANRIKVIKSTDSF